MTTVSSWLTRGSDQSKLFQAQPAITTTASSGASGTNPITIDATTKYQSMIGFGAALTDAAAYTIWSMPSAARSTLMTELFDPVNGYGISCLRLTIGACDFSRGPYTYDDLGGSSTAPTTGNLLPAVSYADTTVGTVGYGSFTSGSTYPTLSVDAASPYSGMTQAIKVTSTASVFTGVYQTSASYASVTVGSSYTALVFMRCPSGSGATHGQVKINWYDSSKTQLSGANGGLDGPLVTLPTGTWTAVAVTQAAPSGAAYASVNMETSSETTGRTLANGDSYSFTALGIYPGTTGAYASPTGSSGGGTDTPLSGFSIAHDMDAVVPLAKAALALNPSLAFIASCWSPPAWMKVGGALNGGALNPTYYSTYAQYLVKYVQAYAAQGITIWGLSVANEPENATGAYPSTPMTAAQQATLIGSYVGPALRAAGLTTKILAYDHNWDDTSFPSTVLSDSVAGPYVDGIAWHAYAGTVAAQTTVHNAYPAKNTYFTEITGSQPGAFQGDLQWHCRNITLGAPINWARLTTHWNLALNENNGPLNGGYTSGQGLIQVNSSSHAVTRYGPYWAVVHSAAKVKPGAQRIGCTNPGTGYVVATAYLNPDGSRVAIFECDATSAQTFNVIEGGQQFTATLQPGDVATYVFPASTTSVPTPNPTPVQPTSPPTVNTPVANVTATGISSPIQVPGLAAGNWKFQVQAVNGSGTSAPSTSSAAVTIAAAPAPVSFVTTANNALVVGGTPTKMTGINVYGAILSANVASTIDSVFASLGTPKTNGAGNLIRFWAFQRGMTVGGVRNWTAMDRVIAAAKARGFRLIPVLLNSGANDECPSVTGANQYWYPHSSTEWYHTADWYESGYKTELEPEWTVTPRAWVGEIAAHYKNEPTIAMWEIHNEAEFPNAPTDGAAYVTVLHNYWNDLGGVIKAADPNHLVTTSVVGTGQNGTSGGDFQTAFNTPNVDVVQVHDYTPQGTTLPGDQYNGLGLRITQAHNLGKAIIIGECGNQVPSTEAATTAARAALFQQKITTDFTNGVAAWVAWSYVNPPGGTPYDIGASDPALSVVFSNPA